MKRHRRVFAILVGMAGVILEGIFAGLGSLEYLHRELHGVFLGQGLFVWRKDNETGCDQYFYMEMKVRKHFSSEYLFREVELDQFTSYDYIALRNALMCPSLRKLHHEHKPLKCHIYTGTSKMLTSEPTVV